MAPSGSIREPSFVPPGQMGSLDVGYYDSEIVLKIPVSEIVVKRRIGSWLIGMILLRGCHCVRQRA